MGTPEFNVGRGQATLSQMGNDIQEGIEGKDMVRETILGVRNLFVAGWHGLQGIIPTLANIPGGQKYNVVRRRGPLHGSINSINKVIETKGIIGKGSAAFAELTDGPVDDAINVAGAGKWIIEPTNSTRSQVSETLAA